MPFSYNGIDELTDTFGKLGSLPEDDKWSILSAMAEVVKQKQSSVIRRLFKQHTGQLAESIEIRKKRLGGELCAMVGPSQKPRKGGYTGTRRRGSARPYARTKSGKMTRATNGSYAGTNAEIGFILEYGTPRIAARHWMETANNEAYDQMIDAGQKAYNDILMRMGLL